jgi:hypothetical protein
MSPACRRIFAHSHRSPRPPQKKTQPPPKRQSGILYPVVVRFETQNYAGTTTNNFGLDEVKQM